MVTQVDIAKRVGLDVSSVNKILNKIKGPTFKPETIKKVFSVAIRLGYKLKRPSKGVYRGILEKLFPRESLPSQLANTRGLTTEEVQEILDLLYKK